MPSLSTVRESVILRRSRRIITSLIILGFMGGFTACAAPLAEHAQGRIIIKFKQDVVIEGKHTGIASIDELNKQYAVSAIEPLSRDKRSAEDSPYLIGLRRTFVLIMPATVDIRKVVVDYQADPSLEYAQLDYIAHIQ